MPIENEILNFIRSKKVVTLRDITLHFGFSGYTVRDLVNRLHEKRTVDIREKNKQVLVWIPSNKGGEVFDSYDE